MHVKDGINDFVVDARQHAVNPEKQGTKVAAHYQVNVGAGQTVVIRLRLSSSVREQKRSRSARRSTRCSTRGVVKRTSSTRRSRRPR